MTFEVVVVLLLAYLPRSLGVIQINQGATKAEVHLARPYTSLGDFQKDLMGKNKYHNLDFTKITAEEVGHLPDDLYAELNEMQARQLVERYQDELAKGVNPISFLNAMKELFASKPAIEGKTLKWLTEKDIDIFGYEPKFMPLKELPKHLLNHLIDRWGQTDMTPIVRRELQTVVLKDLVKNKNFDTVKMNRKFFKNLHTQLTIEHWPEELQNKASKHGASSSKLNKDLGVSQSKSTSEGSTNDSESSTSVEENPRRKSRRGRRTKRKRSRSRKERRRKRKGRKGERGKFDRALMRRATELLRAR